MNLRTFQPGDEAIQAAIYNEAAGDLPRFKAASDVEVKRRTSARNFDPATRYYAEVDGRLVGYAVFQPNGRVSFPWTRRGFEAVAEPLFNKVLDAMKGRGFRQAFAAYRADWKAQNQFFQAHGFRLVREMVNFVLDQVDLPTRPASASQAITAMRPEDVAAVFQLAPSVLRVAAPQQWQDQLFRNPYFSPEALFVLRAKDGKTPLAAGTFVANPTYADPNQLDSDMPCFRLGAFGTEGMEAKRVNGLFSFLTRADANASLIGLELLQHAARLQEQTDFGMLAAQVASDAPHLLRFYQQYFRRQGSFPVSVLSF